MQEQPEPPRKSLLSATRSRVTGCCDFDVGRRQLDVLQSVCYPGSRLRGQGSLILQGWQLNRKKRLRLLAAFIQRAVGNWDSGKGNRRESLINVVSVDKPKMLTPVTEQTGGWDQKVTGPILAEARVLSTHMTQMSRHRRIGEP